MQPPRQTLVAGILGILAAGLVLCFWLPWGENRGRPMDGEEDTVSESVVPPTQAAQSEGASRGKPVPAEAPSAASAREDERDPIPSGIRSVPPVGDRPEEDAQAEPGWEFSKEDIEAAEGFVIEVDLGEYVVRAGEEFEVEVRLTAPPLQAMVLPMNFDGRILEARPGSGQAVGRTFRKGVEFFAKPKGGEMTLFCATFPGMKNILPVEGEIVATFRMRAKGVGRTRIEVEQKLMKFMQGTGVLLEVQPGDGVVIVR